MNQSLYYCFKVVWVLNGEETNLSPEEERGNNPGLRWGPRQRVKGKKANILSETSGIPHVLNKVTGNSELSSIRLEWPGKRSHWLPPSRVYSLISKIWRSKGLKFNIIFHVFTLHVTHWAVTRKLGPVLSKAFCQNFLCTTYIRELCLTLVASRQQSELPNFYWVKSTKWNLIHSENLGRFSPK